MHLYKTQVKYKLNWKETISATTEITYQNEIFWLNWNRNIILRSAFSYFHSFLNLSSTWYTFVTAVFSEKYQMLLKLRR